MPGTRVVARSLLAVAFSLHAGAAASEPWIGPGDVTLRHDLQRLADAGLLTGPTLSWPIGWSQDARELGRIDLQGLDPVLGSSVARLLARAARETRTHDIDVELKVVARIPGA